MLIVSDAATSRSVRGDTRDRREEDVRPDTRCARDTIVGPAHVARAAAARTCVSACPDDVPRVRMGVGG